MTVSEAICSVLAGLVPVTGGAVGEHRCYPDALPEADGPPAVPAIVYQQVGGRSIELLDAEVPDLRNARVQITSWARTRLEADVLAEQVDAAMRLAPGLQATPLGEAIGRYDNDIKLRGCSQDFSIWLPR